MYKKWTNKKKKRKIIINSIDNNYKIRELGFCFFKFINK